MRNTILLPARFAVLLGLGVLISLCLPRQVTLHAQGYPCYATITGGGSSPPSFTWNAALNLYTTSTTHWVEYDCPGGQANNCHVCTQVTYLTSPPGVDPPQWTYRAASYGGSGMVRCGASWKTTFVSTFPNTGGLAPGSWLQVQIWYCAPTNDLPCDGNQTYTANDVWGIRVPPAP